MARHCKKYRKVHGKRKCAKYSRSKRSKRSRRSRRRTGRPHIMPLVLVGAAGIAATYLMAQTSGA